MAHHQPKVSLSDTLLPFLYSSFVTRSLCLCSQDLSQPGLHSSAFLGQLNELGSCPYLLHTSFLHATIRFEIPLSDFVNFRLAFFFLKEWSWEFKLAGNEADGSSDVRWIARGRTGSHVHLAVIFHIEMCYGPRAMIRQNRQPIICINSSLSHVSISHLLSIW